MTVEAGAVERAPCGIGAGIQLALDIACDGFVVAGIGAVQSTVDAGGVSADLISGVGRTGAGLVQFDLKGGAHVAFLRL